MGPFFANDFSGIGQQLATHRSQQMAEQQFREQMLANVLARRQQQGQFDAQQAQAMQMERGRLDAAARENALARALQTRRLTEYEIPSLNARTESATNRAAAEALNFRLQALADNAAETGDFDPNDPAIQAANPLIARTIGEVALRKRMELKPELDRRRRALTVFQQANRMDKVAEGIAANPNPNRGLKWYQALSPLTLLFGGGPSSMSGEGMINPADQATEMKTKAEAMRRGLPPGLMEQFANYQNPSGRTEAEFPKWYLETLPAGDPIRRRAPATGQPGPKVLDAQSATELLRRTGGDKDAARKLAVEMGFQIPQVQ